MMRQSGGQKVRQASSERQKRERRGRLAEFMAALLLMSKGYRVIARRYKGQAGEIDLIAVRGRRLAFVEVKQRQSLEDAATAIGGRQAERIARSAAEWIARHPRYGNHDVGFDAVQVAPWRWPRHARDAYRI
ncbi:MAG: hypothetical protein RLZ98_758 [Pseudomonadota bacterium]|jgi:putative endonuclease